MICPLKRQEGQSDEDYQAACREIFSADKDKAGSSEGAGAVDEEAADEPAAEVEKKEGEAW